MKKVLSVCLRVLICGVILFVSYWFLLPPLNARSGEFWAFLVWSAAVVLVVFFASGISSFVRAVSAKQVPPPSRKGKVLKWFVFCVGGLLVLSVLATLIGSPLFFSSSYEKLVQVNDGDFTADVAELNMSQIPVVDRVTSVILGKRKLGEMSDLVSQFEISEDYTQINYNDVPVRVTPLLYGDIIKWFNNKDAGLPGYLTVNMTTQEATLVRLQEGIRYSESEYFLRNIYRWLRFHYPTKIFSSVSFEIDDGGTPYWVASTVKYRIAFWSGRDVGGVVLVNAVTGESSYYDVGDVPQWVDQVYDADLVLEQLTYNGKYRSGFWNSLFGQRGVLAPTDGYNYLAIDDDVWLYTGMTSVVSDESNVGFVLVNLRTKETRYYAVPGAEEFSAMSSAQGQVQHLGYTSTFPILLNVCNRPTYFMSLKDAAGLVKMYAFVDVQQYQIVATGSSVAAAQEAYLQKLTEDGLIEPADPDPQEQTDPVSEPVITQAEGVVEQVATAVVDGNSMYYIRLQGGDVIVAPIQASDQLPFLSWGSHVKAVLTDGVVTELTVLPAGE